MDIADASDGSIEAVRDIGVARSQQAIKHRELLPVGMCHYCESPVAPNHLFCDMDDVEPDQSCSMLYEYMQRQRKVNGR